MPEEPDKKRPRRVVINGREVTERELQEMNKGSRQIIERAISEPGFIGPIEEVGEPLFTSGEVTTDKSGDSGVIRLPPPKETND